MHLVIIGNGITGITTARYVRKQSDIRITIISNESKYFFSRTALMYVYMGHMKWENLKPYEDWFWDKNKIELLFGKVTSIDSDTKTLYIDNNIRLGYDKLVIATGSETNKFGWKGQDLKGVQGLYSKQDLESLEENSKNTHSAVIVGGGLIGIELAEMLHSRNIEVTFLVREKLYWNNILPNEEAAIVSRHILEHDMQLKLGTELKEILPDANGRVKAILTNHDEEIPCQLVGLTPGVHPNIDFLKNTKIETGRGVLVNDYFETSVPNIYAAGDCAEIKSSAEGDRNKLEQLWYTGKMQGKVLAKNILGEKEKYDRGIWYNSAKFLDIEYQTYGFVSSLPRIGEESFYWEHSSGKISLRIVFSSKDRSIIGVNAFGMRLRHKLFELWIKEKKTIEYVIENLRSANFDPEFYKKHDREILGKFNQENPGKKLVMNKQLLSNINL